MYIAMDFIVIIKSDKAVVMALQGSLHSRETNPAEYGNMES